MFFINFKVIRQNKKIILSACFIALTHVCVYFKMGDISLFLSGYLLGPIYGLAITLISDFSFWWRPLGPSIIIFQRYFVVLMGYFMQIYFKQLFKKNISNFLFVFLYICIFFCFYIFVILLIDFKNIMLMFTIICFCWIFLFLFFNYLLIYLKYTKKFILFFIFSLFILSFIFSLTITPLALHIKFNLQIETQIIVRFKNIFFLTLNSLIIYKIFINLFFKNKKFNNW